MANEEIIERLQVGLENSEMVRNDEMIEVFKVSIEALEKQIPKKPEKNTFVNFEAFYCGNCQKTLWSGNCEKTLWSGTTNYCYHCGQRIDWSE